jgi:hypothetical protein
VPPSLRQVVRRLTGRACGRFPVRRRGKSGLPAVDSRGHPRLCRFERPQGIVSVTSWPVRQWRISGEGARRAGRPDLRAAPCHAADRSPTAGPPGEPPQCWRSDGGVAGTSAWSRRDRRQWIQRFGSVPVGGGGDSPLPCRAARYRHDCARARGEGQPPPASAHARTDRFSAASNRSEVPAIPPALRQEAPARLASRPAARCRTHATPARRGPRSARCTCPRDR